MKWLIGSTSNSALGRVLNWNIALMIHIGTLRGSFSLWRASRRIVTELPNFGQVSCIQKLWGQNCIIWPTSLACWITCIIKYFQLFYLNWYLLFRKGCWSVLHIDSWDSLTHLFQNGHRNSYNFAPSFSSEFTQSWLLARRCMFLLPH